MISTQPEMIIDNQTIKVLSVDTRIKILQLLSKRDHTLSEIAKELNLANSTTKEHLEKLIEVSLIEKEKTDRKWKYYSLTRKGNRIANKRENKTIFILFATILLSFLTIFSYNLIDFDSLGLLQSQDLMSARTFNKMSEVNSFLDTEENCEENSCAVPEIMALGIDENSDFNNDFEKDFEKEKLIGKIKEISLYIGSLIFVLLTGFFIGTIFERNKTSKILRK
ncbi:MAG: winged helix-turn-helix domain-containing protein [Candidatus Nanoarchaeia archaeon]|nr:winged helix-turn-helix domain-containing protein [Candidatus Nanoarchaeia archaeon]